MIKDSPEHAAAEACLYATYPRQNVDAAILKALFDARLVSPTIVHVKEMEKPLDSLGDFYTLEFLSSFQDPCEELKSLDLNAIEDRFQTMLKNKNDALRYWVVDNLYSKPIFDERAYYDSGLSAAIFHEYEQARLEAGMPTLDAQTKLAVLNFVARMVNGLLTEFEETVFVPPNDPRASHPEVRSYLRNLATFSRFRDAEFRKSPSAKKAYIQLFDEIRDFRNHAHQTAISQRNLAIGALVVCVSTGLWMMKRSRSRSVPQPARPKARQIPWTKEQEEYAAKRYARTDWPALIVDEEDTNES